VTIDPPLAPKLTRLVGLDRGRLAARNLLNVRFHLRQRAANADTGVPRGVDKLRDDFDPESPVIRDNEHSRCPEAPERRLQQRAHLAAPRVPGLSPERRGSALSTSSAVA
jgi:hypothetical protein